MPRIPVAIALLLGVVLAGCWESHVRVLDPDLDAGPDAAVVCGAIAPVVEVPESGCVSWVVDDRTRVPAPPDSLFGGRGTPIRLRGSAASRLLVRMESCGERHCRLGVDLMADSTCGRFLTTSIDETGYGELSDTIELVLGLLAPGREEHDVVVYSRGGPLRLDWCAE